jgi:hypothetical protein
LRHVGGRRAAASKIWINSDENAAFSGTQCETKASTVPPPPLIARLAPFSHGPRMQGKPRSNTRRNALAAFKKWIMYKDSFSCFAGVIVVPSHSAASAWGSVTSFLLKAWLFFSVVRAAGQL